MGVTNSYIVQYLSEAAAAGDEMIWRERENGGFFTHWNGVRIDLYGVGSSTGTRHYLVFSRDEDRVFIEEPQSTALFSRKYREEGDRELVDHLRSLLRTVSRQCAERRAAALEGQDRRREEIFQQVLFGEAAAGVAGRK